MKGPITYQRQLEPQPDEQQRAARPGAPAAGLEMSLPPGPGQILLSMQGRYGNRHVQHVVAAARRGSTAAPIQAKAAPPRPNRTGLPDGLKAGVEGLSGLSLDDVRVHYSSSKPAQVQALAYTQGTEIHIAPGQERHLPHEAWHVVQQKQGRVQPTFTARNGFAINDSPSLEVEADFMGQTSLQLKTMEVASRASDFPSPNRTHPLVAQLVREKIHLGKPEAISLASLKTVKAAVDVEIAQIGDEIENGFISPENQANITRWLGQYGEAIIALEALHPGDLVQTFEQIKSKGTEIQQAMWRVFIALANIRGVLNESLQEFNGWLARKNVETAANSSYAAYADKKPKEKEPQEELKEKEPRKTPTKSGPIGLGKKWGVYNKKLAALEKNTQFLQLVPEGAETVNKALQSQKILDAVFHHGKAFWVAAASGEYRLAASSGKVMMIYTFTPAGAKSLMQDYLICGSGDFAEDNEEEWKGEARHPDYTIWKPNEIGAFGIGANRLAGLAEYCVSIECITTKEAAKRKLL